LNYSDRLSRCRNDYPFSYWLEDYEEGIGRYSKDCCEMVESIFEGLIESLINSGESETEVEKVRLFEGAVKRLNNIRQTNPELIETMEREEFCELFDTIALASGVDPKNYGGGDGIASEWRGW